MRNISRGICHRPTRFRAVLWLLVGTLALTELATTKAVATEAVPIGNSDFVFSDENGNADKPIRVWLYRPEGLTVDSSIVFVMHGTLRNGETYRGPWIPLADRYKAMVVVPEFSHEHYKEPSTYQFGNLRTPNGEPIEESKWTFSAIEHLFDHLKATTGNRSEKYFLFGHSAGSQFVHRMVQFKTGARIALAVTANAGSYTMPTFDTEFPYGLAKSEMTDSRLKSAFGVPMLVLLGERDVDPNDKYLPKNPESMAQGPFRLARGNNFFRTAETEAKRLNVPLRWTKTVVANVGHDNAKMAPVAARAMFDSREQ